MLGGWRATLPQFISGAYAKIGERPIEVQARTISIASNICHPVPRQVVDPNITWEGNVDSATRLEIVGDSLTVIRWHQGVWTTSCVRHLGSISSTINVLARWHRKGTVLTRTAATDFYRHVYGELNKRADHLANSVLDGTLMRWSYTLPDAPKKILAHFDGAKRGGGPAAAAWTIEGEMGDGVWAVLAEGGALLTITDTVTDAELTAQEEAVKAALSLIGERRVTWNPDGRVVLACCMRE